MKGESALDKSILSDYIDACELIKELEEDIQKLKKREVVQDKVYGSNPDFPYQAQSFRLNGMVETYLDEENLKKEREILKERKRRAEKIKLQVEEWMNTIPLRMQRIIQYKIFERDSWEQVAKRIGGNITADSVRMEYYKFMKKQK